MIKVLIVNHAAVNMNIESQVCSLELSKRLKELGVKQESLLFWLQSTDGIYAVCSFFDSRMEPFSAFTASEIGEMLPHDENYGCFHERKTSGAWTSELQGKVGGWLHAELADTEANARAKMLVYLIEQGIVKV